MSVATISRWVPGVAALSGYRSRYLPKDIVAGLVLSALLVPQGMAYAELAGLPAVTGLYTSILCLIAYAIFGPSRVLVLGPDSSLGPMIAATLLPLAGANGDPVRAVALASMLAIFTGVIMVGAGVGKFGFVADLLSKPTILGYMNGLALTIIVGQLPKLLGFSVDADGFLGEFVGFVEGVASGEVVVAAAAIGVFSLALILVMQRWLPKLPAVLIAVVAAIVATIVFDLGARGVKLVGILPQGLPHLTSPAVAWADMLPLFLGAMGIALVALTDTISTATSFAERRGEEVDGNKEMIGVGAANIAAGAFQGFPVSASGSRTAVAEQSGAKSQLTGLVGALVIAVMLLALPALFADLPQPTLGAVVVTAAITLADLPATRRLWSQRRAEFALSIVAFLGVVFLGVLVGIVVAIALSVGNVFRRVWWPYQATLGQVPDLPGLHDTARFPTAAVLPGCAVLRFDAPLIFANARTFRDRVRALAAPLPAGGWIIIAAEPITEVDTTACDMISDLSAILGKADKKLVFAELNDPVRRKLSKFGLDDVLPDEMFFPTLRTAVDAYRAFSGEDWNPPQEVPPNQSAL
jgi:high affinity sulfate transporter 1